jgi:acetoin utilization protein AcuB
MSLSKIMTCRVVTVQLDDTLHTIKDIFEQTKFHHLVVLNEGKVAGIISDRDLLKATSPFLDTIVERKRDLLTLERKAHQIMTRKLLSLKPTDSIFSAIELFNRHSVSCIPIVNESDEIEGIVSWRDIMRYMEDKVEAKKE